jgi:type IV secretion system protein VirB2
MEVDMLCFSGFDSARFAKIALLLILGLMLAGISSEVLANGGGAAPSGFKGACDKVVGFFARFETILRVASISIVTISVVFAGYQIAFAHKRLSDVAPVLIGGLLIGGAATIATWFVGDLDADRAANGKNYVANCGA